MPNNGNGECSRRQVLKISGGAAATATVAGCLGDDEGSDEPTDDGEEYPSDDIRFIIPFGAGGGTDTYNRQVMGMATEELGVNLQAENIEGAASLRGVGEAAQSEGDGYTLTGFNPPSTPVSWLINQQDWDIAEFEGVARYAFTPYTVAARTELEIESFDDLLERYASGELETLGGQERGGVHHVCALLLQDLYDWEWENYVGYDGSASTAEALAGGEIDVGIINDDGVGGVIEDGSVELITVLTSEGSERYPDAPTVVDQGYENIDYIGQITRCIYAPPGTPQDRVETMSETIEEVMQSDEFLGWAEETGNPHNYGGPEAANSALRDAMEQIPNSIDIEEVQEEA